jgi:hypothetical protein
MVVPSTANGFKAAVSVLRSLDVREGLSLHTFALTEDRCVRFLVKNLGRGMPESVVREELRPWTFLARNSFSCVSAAVIRTQSRTALSP